MQNKTSLAITAFADFPYIVLDSHNPIENITLKACISLEPYSKGDICVAYRVDKLLDDGNWSRVVDTPMPVDDGPIFPIETFFNAFMEYARIPSDTDYDFVSFASAEDMPYFPAGTPIVSESSYFQIPECWYEMFYDPNDPFPEGWKSKVEKIRPPRGARTYGTISFSAGNDVDIPPHATAIVHNLNGDIVYDVMQRELQQRIDLSGISAFLEEAKFMFQFYEVADSNVNTFPSAEPKQEMVEDSKLAIYNPFFAEFEKGKFSVETDRLIFDYAENTPFISFHSESKESMFRKPGSYDFVGVCYYDRKENEVITEVYLDDGYTDKICASFVIGYPVNHGNSIAGLAQSCIIELAKAIGPKN